MILSTFINRYDAPKIDFNLIKDKITDIYVSENYLQDPKKAYELVQKAKKENIKVHAWVFCFNQKGEFKDPTNQIIQDTIIQRIVDMIPFNFDGFVLDYVIYPGTAYRYTKATNTITTFIARVRNVLPKSIELSACTMPECSVNAYYYGQDYKQISKYATIIPMAYKGNYKTTTTWIQNVCSYIRKEIGTRKLICSIQTYKSDEEPVPLTKEEITQDIKACIGGGSNGVALFRYGITTKEFFKDKNVIGGGNITKHWILTGYFKEDLQDTSYTCGPSSLSMALSALGCDVSERQLAKWAGTTKKGTTSQGMQKAVIAASKKCNIKLTVKNVSFKKTGWKKLEKYLKDGCEIIIHVMTYPHLAYDYKGNPVWRSAYGHYTYLVGLNPTEKLVEIVIKQSQVLLSIQRRLLDCERYRLKLETKKIDELISHHLQSKEPDNRDVF